MILSAAETPEMIRLTFPEEDGRHLVAKVDSGRLVMARQTRMVESAAMLGRITGDDIPFPSDPVADKIAAAGAAIRAGTVDPSDMSYSAEWDIPTIRIIRAHLLANMPLDTQTKRLYDELWNAEGELRTTYEAAQSRSYPLPELTAITGPVDAY